MVCGEVVMKLEMVGMPLLMVRNYAHCVPRQSRCKAAEIEINAQFLRRLARMVHGLRQALHLLVSCPGPSRQVVIR